MRRGLETMQSRNGENILSFATSATSRWLLDMEVSARPVLPLGFKNRQSAGAFALSKTDWGPLSHRLSSGVTLNMADLPGERPDRGWADCRKSGQPPEPARNRSGHPWEASLPQMVGSPALPVRRSQLPCAKAARSAASSPQSAKNRRASPPGRYWWGKSVENSSRSTPTIAAARAR